MRKVFFVGVAALGAATLAPAQIKKVGNAYQLRVKYKKGQMLKFTSSNQVKGLQGFGQPDSKLTSPIQLNVLDVNKGIANIKVTVGPLKNGNQVMYEQQSTAVKVDTRNQPVGETSAAAQAMGAVMPLAAIKIGETWSSTVPIALGSGSPTPMKMKYRLQKVDGKVAFIALSVDGFAKGGGQMKLSTADGTLLGMTLKLSVNMGEETATLNSTISRR